MYSRTKIRVDTSVPSACKSVYACRDKGCTFPSLRLHVKIVYVMPSHNNSPIICLFDTLARDQLSTFLKLSSFSLSSAIITKSALMLDILAPV